MPVFERGDADVLEVGTERVRRPNWQRLAALTLALVVGITAGAGGTYWYLTSKADRADRQAIDLIAQEDGGIAIVDPTDRCATATIRLRNVGPHPITVERVYADLTGHGSDQSVPTCQLQESTPHPTNIEPKASQAWTIVFRMECEQAWGTPTYRATVTTVSGDRREVSAPIERPDPAPATFSCDGDPDLLWDDVASPVAGSGSQATVTIGGTVRSLTGRLDLLSMRLEDGSGLDLQLEPFESISVDTRPHPFSARVRVLDCAVAQQLPDTMIELRVRTQLGRARAALPFDEPRNVTRSLVRLVDAACGM